MVQVDHSGLVTGFIEKPSEPVGNLANAGMYAFNPSVLLEIDDTIPNDIGHQLLPGLVGRARALPVEGYFRDIGTPAAYQRRSPGMAPTEGAVMIITQTPLRIGLVGGGTDLPDYYVEHGGRVLNCAIDKYVYVIVKQRFDDDIYVNYSEKEIVSSVEDLRHDLVREAMLMTGVKHGVEITMLADIPSSGSGLGSSSSITVGLLHALSAYQGRQMSGEELAEQACTIEIELCGKRIGKQDQYIAALGGIRDLHFGPGPQVFADEIELSPVDRRTLQGQFMLFYTGVTRSADTILREQSANVATKLPQLHSLRDLAAATSESFAQGRRRGRRRRNSTGLGDQATARIRCVERADRSGRRAGALSGRDRGQRSPEPAAAAFCWSSALPRINGPFASSLGALKELPVKFDRLGSRVVLNIMRDIWS